MGNGKALSQGYRNLTAWVPAGHLALGGRGQLPLCTLRVSQSSDGGMGGVDLPRRAPRQCWELAGQVCSPPHTHAQWESFKNLNRACF